MSKKKYKILLLFVLIVGISVLGKFIFFKKHSLLRPDVTIIGNIVMADGIGRQTAELAKALSEKYRVQIKGKILSSNDLPSKIKKLCKKKYKKQGKIVILEDCLWFNGHEIGSHFKTARNDEEIRFAYSMLESTRIPYEWVLYLNLYFDAVIVPDPFLIDAYKNSGVTLPIFHIPLAVNIDKFLQRPIKKRKENNPMVFANLSSAHNRKNQVTLIKSFTKVLGNNPKAMLVINSRGGFDETKNNIKKAINESGCSNIHFSNFQLKGDAYLNFFENVDCYVSLSKGEGFSIQPREAMALGIPVIATNNTGQTTICQSGLVKAVKSNVLIPADYQEYLPSVGQMFDCTVDDAAEAFLDVFHNYDQYLQQKEEARKWASQYSYSNKNLTQLYETVINPKEVYIGSKNVISKDGIETTSSELYKKYKRLILRS